jgi:UDP-N-acetylmuramyl pentapeptide phosphotransferase/UDP-N-acetylglucosamine-1-phosphate transferase
MLLGFTMAFGITWFTIPSIVTIAKLKNLCAIPNSRTAHKDIVPSLGGIAIFIAFILSAVIFAGDYFHFELKYIIAGLLVVFFIGIKDDILIIAPVKKLIGQIFAAGMIAVLADIRINNLYGLFQITELPYVISILLTVFVYIVIINGFNLIDGIDGLASGVGILTAAVFGTWFWFAGNKGYTIISFALAGTLAAFFYFNVFSGKNKIFLGDTGSLIIGFVISVLTCRFLQFELMATGTAHIESAPTVAIGILIIPLFDSLRVFVLRIIAGKSPFRADRQHLHHYLLRLGYSHLKSTAILIGVNVLFIALSFLLRGFGILGLLAIILTSATALSFMLVKLSVRKREYQVNSLLNYFFILKTLKKRKDVYEPEVRRTIRIPVPATEKVREMV